MACAVRRIRFNSVINFWFAWGTAMMVKNFQPPILTEEQRLRREVASLKQQLKEKEKECRLWRQVTQDYYKKIMWLISRCCALQWQLYSLTEEEKDEFNKTE